MRYKKLMNPIYFSIGGLVFAIGIFKRELLVQEDSFKIILGISIVLFFAAWVLHLTDVKEHSACGALLCPLFSLGLYRFSRRVFIRRFHREPRDTWMNWNEGMGADRIFNIIVFGAIVWLWLLCAVFMLELGKAGW
jgi:hypothetical protein